MNRLVCAITVLYRPDEALLRAQAAALGREIGPRLWVDNGPHDDSLQARARDAGASYLALGGNRGIAAAQNRGIDWARAQSATHLLLLDQDSVPAEGFASRLLQALADAPGTAAAGPAWASTPAADAAQRAEERKFLIASGMLAPMEAFARAGPLREDLFIDHVDTEWCWRARAAGIRFLLVHGARMEHRLGDGGTRFWLLRWRRLAHYPPWRSYMQTRNSLALLRDPATAGLPLAPRAYLVWRALCIGLLALVLQQERGLRLRWLRRALSDGWHLRLGPPPEDGVHPK